VKSTSVLLPVGRVHDRAVGLRHVHCNDVDGVTDEVAIGVGERQLQRRGIRGSQGVSAAAAATGGHNRGQRGSRDSLQP